MQVNQVKSAIEQSDLEMAVSQPDAAVQAREKLQACKPEPLHMKGARIDMWVSLHEDIAELEAEWRRFEKIADCTVFQSFIWLSTWLRHIGRRKETRCVISTGRDEKGDLMFVLPLAVEWHGLSRTLTWLGSDNNDYNAPLFARHCPQWTREDFLELWQHILRRVQSVQGWRYDLVELVRMPAALGTRNNPFLYLPVHPHPDHAYLTRLGSDWETYYAGKRSAATRSRERTKRNRLGELGTIAFFTPRNPEEIGASVDQLIAQKTLAFAGMGARNIFQRPGWAAFYRDLASNPDAAGFAHTSRLDVGSTASAINLGLIFQGTYHHLLASHTEEVMARFSPGAVHLQELMRYAISQGCAAYDFTIGDEPYKRDWSEVQSVLFDHVSAVGVRGMPLAPAIRLQSRMKRFIKQTPAVWSAFVRWRARLASLRPSPTAQP
ncbi:MAG: GNAT family N-acetyltransferase [Pseudomonadota bacterium]